MVGIDPMVTDAAAVPTICGWLEIVKVWIPDSLKKFLPLAAILLGIAYALTVRPSGLGTLRGVVMGALIGITASGAWSAGKNLMESGKK